MSAQADEASKPVSEPAAAEFRATNAYRYYVVWLLFAVYVLNFVDRQILAILNEQLKAEFGLSDTELGILGGLAFAALYSILGLPIARWADRSSRVRIISVAILVWSAFTALSAYAKVTWHLVIARIGVGIGEAGCSPPAYSLISDYFDQKRRGRALSIYSMGVYGGGFVGLFIGGLVAEQYGWRMAFLVAGLPGIVLALIVKLTLREPPRGFSDPPNTARVAAPPAMVVLRNLWAKESFRWLAIAAALHALAGYGVGHFYASFLVRSHGLSIGEVGQVLGVIVAVGGLSGTYLGGYLSDRYCERHGDIRYYLFVPAVLLAINIPVAQLVYGMSDRTAVLLTMVPYIALSASYLGPGIAITHRLVTVGERAVASALLLLVITLIGLGLGPLMAGLVSDVLKQMFIDNGASAAQATGDGLRWSLRIITLINVFSVWFYVLAARKLREEAA
jgi:MFS family permease